jgi:hypothetical protein
MWHNHRLVTLSVDIRLEHTGIADVEASNATGMVEE